MSDIGEYNATPITLTDKQQSAPQVDQHGYLLVNVASGGGGGSSSVTLLPGTAKVGQIAIDQTTPGTTNAIQLTGPGLSSNNPLYVNNGAGTSGTVKNSGQIVSSTQIVAGSTSTLAASAITTGKIASLEHLVMSSAGPMRWDVQNVPNSGGSPITVYTFFTSTANANAEFKAMPGGEWTLPAADGTNAKFQVLVTNLDSSVSNYAYATFAWIEN